MWVRCGCVLAAARIADSAVYGPRQWVQQPTPCAPGWSFSYSDQGDEKCIRVTRDRHKWGPEPCDDLRSGAELATLPDASVQLPVGAWLEDTAKAWTGLNRLPSARLNWTWSDGRSAADVPWAPTRPRPDPVGTARDCAYMTGLGVAAPDEGRCVYASGYWPLGAPYLCEADCGESFAYACQWTPPPNDPCPATPSGWLYDGARNRCVRVVTAAPGGWALGDKGVCNDTAGGGAPGGTLLSLETADEAKWLKLKLKTQAEVWVGLSRPAQNPRLLEWEWAGKGAVASLPVPFKDAWAGAFPSDRVRGGCAYLAGVPSPPPPPPSPPPPPPPCPSPPPPPDPNSTDTPSAAPTNSPSNATVAPTVGPSGDPGPACPENSGQLCDGGCDEELHHLCQYSPYGFPWPPAELPMAPAMAPTMTKTPRAQTVTKFTPTGTRTRSATPPLSPTPTATRSAPVSPTASRTRLSPTATPTEPLPEEDGGGSSPAVALIPILLLCCVAAAFAWLRQRKRRTYVGDHLKYANADEPVQMEAVEEKQQQQQRRPEHSRYGPDSDCSDSASTLGTADSGAPSAPYTAVRDAGGMQLPRTAVSAAAAELAAVQPAEIRPRVAALVAQRGLSVREAAAVVLRQQTRTQRGSASSLSSGSDGMDRREV
eukprot:TRINITY_DN1338_c4_g1_i1.p1 TRINITY_DN1338_c4_g1~~TRINITY_DN1338_c4_g1_i1.p1  ORF type:complete len:653 (+),score=246.08 TRINITY_DN1338_c4_g1_i1:352-2310(+)